MELGSSASGDSAEINGPGIVVVAGTGITAGTIATMQINAPYMGLYGGARVAVGYYGQILGSTTERQQFDCPQRPHLRRRLYRQRRERAHGRRPDARCHHARHDRRDRRTSAMVLETGSNAITNGGLIETTAAGGLTIDSNMYQNGRLAAAGTGALTINGALVQGLGNVSTSSTGSIVLHHGQLSIGGLVDIGSTAAAGGTLTTTSGDMLGLLASSGDSFAGADVLTADIYNYGTITSPTTRR